MRPCSAPRLLLLGRRAAADGGPVAGAGEVRRSTKGGVSTWCIAPAATATTRIGGVMAPDLRASVARGAVDEQSFRTVVLQGRREKGMPGFKGVLTDEQVAAIQAYVAARASGKLKAGRPA